MILASDRRQRDVGDEESLMKDDDGCGRERHRQERGIDSRDEEEGKGRAA
jgi:hypothetical protein